VQAARQAGAQFVIAVNVYPRETPASASSKQRARDERRRRLMAPELPFADFVLQADAGYETGPLQRYFDAARQAGEREMRARWPQLEEVLRAKLYR
jgi:hypothetical protein